MNKTTDVVVLKSEPADKTVLRDIAARVLQNHMLAKNLAQHAVIYAAKCGAELLTAKNFCKHGEFGPWCEEHLIGLSRATAARYMQLAEHMAGRLDGKFLTVRNLDGPAPAQVEARYEQIAKLSLLQLPDPRDTKACAKNPQLEAFTKATDGRTLTQLYMDFGIIAEPHHPGTYDRSKAAPADPAKVMKMKREAAAARLNDVMAAMEAARPFCLVADKPLLEELERERINFGHFLAPLLKGKKGGTR